MAPSKRHEPRLIVIGSGVAGIALSAKLKNELGFHNFTIYGKSGLHMITTIFITVANLLH
jgi:cation diffusion facilitator CzcD-associated flavoprotein CzcO